MPDLEDIREALKKNPDNPAALKGAAKHFLDEQQYKQANNYYSQAARLSPRLLPEIVIDYEAVIRKNITKMGPRLSLVGFYLFQGETDNAVLELEEILDTNPQCKEAYNLLGRIAIRQDKIDEAIMLLEKSIKEGIKDVALTEILAGAYLEKGRINDAVKFYNEVLEHRPADKQILRMLGELYTRLQDYTAAAKAFQAMFSDDPAVSREVISRLEGLLKKIEGSVVIREILAEIYMRSLMPDAAAIKLQEIIKLDAAKLDNAINQLKSILKTYPLHPAVTLVLAEAFRRQGGFSESAECYHELVKTKVDFLDDVIEGYQAIIQLCPGQVLAHIYLAEAYLQKGQVGETLKNYEAILQTDPTVVETIIQKCREILKSQPQLSMAHLVLGKAYLIQGDFQRAASEAEGIILADEKCTAAYLLLGEAHLHLKALRKASDTFRQALSFDPYNREAQEKYGLAKAQEIGNEIDVLKSRLTEDPWKVSLHLDLAKLFAQKGMNEEAIRELQMTLKDQTRAPFACNLLGCIYRGEGHYALAAAQFNRSLELTPPEIASFGRAVRFNLGSTYEAQGMVQKALKIYEGIMQEDIDFGGLKKRIQILKATNLESMRNKRLLLALAQYDKAGIIALWGSGGKSGLGSKKEEVSVSFGQSHNLSGYEYYLKGMNKAAREEFQLAVQLDGNYAVALNNWGVALVSDNKLPEAVRRFDEAVRLAPTSALFRNNLGVAYYLVGQKNKAQKELETARELGLEASALNINLGDVYYSGGEIEKATRLYQQVGDFDPLKELAERRLLFKIPS